MKRTAGSLAQRPAFCGISRRPIVVRAMQQPFGGGGMMGGMPGMGGGMPMGGSPGMGGGPNSDPEGMFKAIPLASGIIEKRLMNKRRETDKEFSAKFEAAVARYKSEEMAEAEMRRAARTPPEDPEMLVEYFLDTTAEDMEYEVARCRPMLTPQFFAALDKIIGKERFAPEPDQDRIAELELVRQYLDEATKAVDTAIQATTSAVERMKKLLGAKDKKQMILDMAAANEIDMALMDLLQQNIEAARVAGQQEAAAFMEKVRTAAGKYAVAAPTAAVAPEVPATLGGVVIKDGSDAVERAEKARRRQLSTGLIYADPKSAQQAPAQPPPPQQQGAPADKQPGSSSGLIL